MEISFDGTYDRQAFEKGLALLERRPATKQIVFWLMVLALALSLALGIYEWLQGKAGSSLLVKLARPGFLALLLGYYYLWPRLARRNRVNQLFKELPIRKMTGRAGPEGILLEPAQKRNVLFRWEQFIRKGRQDPLLALRMVDGTMAIFQRNFFQSEADWSRFTQMVEQRVIEPK